MAEQTQLEPVKLISCEGKLYLLIPRPFKKDGIQSVYFQ